MTPAILVAGATSRPTILPRSSSSDGRVARAFTPAASSAVVTLAVQRAGVDELPGSGFLVPPVEGRTIKAIGSAARRVIGLNTPK